MPSSKASKLEDDAAYFRFVIGDLAFVVFRLFAGRADRSSECPGANPNAA